MEVMANSSGIFIVFFILIIVLFFGMGFYSISIWDPKTKIITSRKK